MLLLIGLPLIIFKSELPAWLESGAEKAVGVVILVLAARVLWKWAHGDYRSTPHVHGTEGHRHLHREGTHPHTRSGPPRRRSGSGSSTASPALAPWFCC